MAHEEHIDDIHRIPPGVHRPNLEQANQDNRRKRKKKSKKVDIGNANVDGGILNGQDTNRDIGSYNRMGEEIRRRVLKGTR